MAERHLPKVDVVGSNPISRLDLTGFRRRRTCQVFFQGPPMPRKYTMDDATQIARRAARDFHAWLSADPCAVRVRNVEDDPEWRRVDVDLMGKRAGARTRSRSRATGGTRPATFSLRRTATKRKQRRAVSCTRKPISCSAISSSRTSCTFYPEHRPHNRPLNNGRSHTAGSLRRWFAPPNPRRRQSPCARNRVAESATRIAHATH